MTPYYADDLVTIYHGDCREIDLAELGADAVLTDPPYGIDYRPRRGNSGIGRLYRSAKSRTAWPEIAGDDRPFDPVPLLSFGIVVLFGADHFAARLPASGTWIVWDKRVDMPSNDQADCEFIWCSRAAPSRIYRQRWNGLAVDSDWIEDHMGAPGCGKRRLHPTQKPVRLLRWLVDREIRPGLTVLDPFMGSGSTLVATKSLGRRAIGIEIEERYCEIAALRCSQEVLGLEAS